MKTSNSILKIAPALLAAQKEIGGATKTGKNPFFHSDYATLGDVMEACKDILNKNGISVLQPIEANDAGVVFVETVLLHTSGEWILAGMKIAPKSETNPQDQGSAISYARRYSLQSMVFIPSVDDDAEGAVNRSKIAPQSPTEADTDPEWVKGSTTATVAKKCSTHNMPLLQGISRDKKDKDGNPKKYWYHPIANGELCFGH